MALHERANQPLASPPSFFSRRLSITLVVGGHRTKSAFRRPARGVHYPTRACTARTVFRFRTHVRHVCHGRRGPGRPGTHASARPRPMRRRDVDSRRVWICAFGCVATTAGRRKRRAAQPRLDSPPRLTAHRPRRHHRAGPLRRQVRQGCQGPPLGRRRRRDGARDHREAEAQVREEEHHREARGGGHRRLLHRQSGTSFGHIASLGDAPARPASKTPRVGSISSVPDSHHAGVFRDVTIRESAKKHRTRQTRIRGFWFSRRAKKACRFSFRRPTTSTTADPKHHVNRTPRVRTPRVARSSRAVVYEPPYPYTETRPGVRVLCRFRGEE